MAALPVLAAGHQVAIMAPTEILAEQHFKAFSAWLKPMGFEVDWFAGSQKARDKKPALERLASGVCQVAVGTHALFQEVANFHDLGLVIVDEQHRFGVHQRLELTTRMPNSALTN